MAQKKDNKDSERLIAENRKARYDYFIEERLEAGIALEGWEVKSLRAGQGADHRGLCVPQGRRGVFVWRTPRATQDHVDACRRRSDPHAQVAAAAEASNQHTDWQRRARGLYAGAARPALHSNGRIKLEIGLAKGKKQHDKRATEKDRDWQRNKARILRRG